VFEGREKNSKWTLFVLNSKHLENLNIKESPFLEKREIKVK
jgi:hypothetical protein